MNPDQMPKNSQRDTKLSLYKVSGLHPATTKRVVASSVAEAANAVKGCEVLSVEHIEYVDMIAGTNSEENGG